MELRQLRYFVAVAEDQSFTRAGERLHVAQPALSVQVRRLEKELGVELLDRSRRTIRVTDAGAMLQREARRLLNELDQTVELVRRTGMGGVGRLAVGFVPSAANEVLPPLLRRYGAAHPGVELSLHEMAPDALVRSLHQGRLDVAFLYLPFDDPTLDTAVVARESFIAALPSDHPLAESEPVDVDALAGEPFILPARHGMPGLHAQVLGICTDAGFTPRAVQENVWLVQTIVGLVAAGVGVALLPASARALARRGVVYRTLRGDTAHVVELAAVWRRDDRSPILGGLLGEVVAAAPAPPAAQA
jgi:DNA-binding transcriptional LysR family regulator